MRVKPYPWRLRSEGPEVGGERRGQPVQGGVPTRVPQACVWYTLALDHPTLAPFYFVLRLVVRVFTPVK